MSAIRDSGLVNGWVCLPSVDGADMKGAGLVTRDGLE